MVWLCYKGDVTENVRKKPFLLFPWKTNESLFAGPVEKVTVEIHDPKSHTVLAKKTVPVSAQDQAVELKPGKYMVGTSAYSPVAVLNFFE